ncbi:hypothetical protein MP638_003584 [Amoeboaphelidium occidentale]|nr:hypothetical protein MP638_003584 [Amoeboaphelidium occidentale]
MSSPKFTANQPSLVEYGRLRFLIMDAPSDSTLSHYIKDFEKYNCKDVVRLCQPTYKKEALEKLNIKVHDWPFADGEAPPANIVDDFLKLVNDRFSSDPNSNKQSIACHCVAGLGRAPVLVAIALIEEGMSNLDSVAYVRERRRGAINNKQLRYIEAYKRRKGKNGKCCIQ